MRSIAQQRIQVLTYSVFDTPMIGTTLVQILNHTVITQVNACIRSSFPGTRANFTRGHWIQSSSTTACFRSNGTSTQPCITVEGMRNILQ